MHITPILPKGENLKTQNNGDTDNDKKKLQPPNIIL